MTVAEEIAQLKGLLDQGALTQEEFDEQKAKVLNGGQSNAQSIGPLSQEASGGLNMASTEATTVSQAKKKTSVCSVIAFICGIIGFATTVIPLMMRFSGSPAGGDALDVLVLIVMLSWPLTIVFSIIGLVQTFGKKKRAGKAFSIIAPILIAVSIGCIVVFSHVPRTNNFSETYASLASQSFCTISGDGKTMQIDTNPSDLDDYSNERAIRAIQQINDDLGFGSSATARMSNTRALDGTQTASTDFYTATWTYHPDRGLVVVYTLDE